MNDNSGRRPLVSDAKPEHQQMFAAYLNGGDHDLVSYEIWLDWMKFGTGRVEHWIPGQGSVRPTPTARSNS